MKNNDNISLLINEQLIHGNNKSNKCCKVCCVKSLYTIIILFLAIIPTVFLVDCFQALEPILKRNVKTAVSVQKEYDVQQLKPATLTTGQFKYKILDNFYYSEKDLCVYIQDTEQEPVYNVFLTYGLTVTLNETQKQVAVHCISKNFIDKNAFKQEQLFNQVFAALTTLVTITLILIMQIFCFCNTYCCCKQKQNKKKINRRKH